MRVLIPSLGLRLPRGVFTRLFVCTLLTSCTIGQVEPEATGGRVLPSTEGLDWLGGRPFSVSPDGRWILYSRGAEGVPVDADEGLRAITLRQLTAYHFHDVERSTSTPVGLSSEARAFVDGESGVLPGGCWVRLGADLRVLVQDSYGRYLGADPNAAAPEWTVDDVAPFSFREQCPRRERMPRAETALGPFRIVKPRGDEVVITDGDGQVLARHRVPFWALGLGEILISDVSLAPGGNRLGYVVSQTIWLVLRSRRGYILAPETSMAGPSILTSEVSVLEWGENDSTVYGYVRPPGRERAIYGWKSPGRLER